MEAGHASWAGVRPHVGGLFLAGYRSFECDQLVPVQVATDVSAVKITSEGATTEA